MSEPSGQSTAPRRWAPRRTLSFVLMISGAIWIVLGLLLKFLVR
jgi:hypothetical protein